MKAPSFLSAVLLATTVAGSSVLAQDSNPTTSSPAPVTAPAAPTVVHGVVYVEKLPTPTSLLKDAEAEGLTIIRMEQSPDRLIVVYQYPSGATRAFAYTTTVTAATMTAASPAAQSNRLSSATYTLVSAPPPNVQVVYPEPPTVYYEQPATIYYPPRYTRYYEPVWNGWAPLALGLGIGLSWHHGGYYDGYHGGHYDGHHGGWRH